MLPINYGTTNWGNLSLALNTLNNALCFSPPPIPRSPTFRSLLPIAYCLLSFPRIVLLKIRTTNE